MKELVILIVMMFPDYGVYPDSVAVSHFEGKPLVFNNEDKCEEWIWNDLEKSKRIWSSSVSRCSCCQINHVCT